MIGMPMNAHYWFIREAHESWERKQRHMYCLTSPHSTKSTPTFASKHGLAGWNKHGDVGQEMCLKLPCQD